MKKKQICYRVRYAWFSNPKKSGVTFNHTRLSVAIGIAQEVMLRGGCWAVIERV